ncbi:mechanosensitive ion channel [Nibrella saemangeumensis]|uniref:Mechanosensitive ion channel n=1 Tax=Nibrella saemangeumensis TaxID=1084526 RepID=A0ABP8NAC5_9BACT
MEWLDLNWTDAYTDFSRWLRQNRAFSGWVLLGIAVVAGLIINFLVTQIVRFILRRGQHETLGLLRLHVRNAFYVFSPALCFLILTNLQRRALVRHPIASTISEAFFIIACTWLVVQLLKVVELLLIRGYDTSQDTQLHIRKYVTQIKFFRRLVATGVVIIGFSILLLSFQGGRKVGLSILTSAGIVSVVVGFAAQRTLANLLAGIQIAFNQQIRVDDVVVVENEWGRIEEINLTNVVVRLWDRRRLILPITYFVEKPFQNWTRSQASVLGAVMLYLDYRVPVDKLRHKCRELVEDHPLWDGEVLTVQVTDTMPDCIQVRVLVSARNSGEAFDLRCLIREAMIEYLREHHPESLPQTRLQFVDASPRLPDKKEAPENPPAL